jgi:hypothetical protein
MLLTCNPWQRVGAGLVIAAKQDVNFALWHVRACACADDDSWISKTKDMLSSLMGKVGSVTQCDLL